MLTPDQLRVDLEEGLAIGGRLLLAPRGLATPLWGPASPSSPSFLGLPSASSWSCRFGLMFSSDTTVSLSNPLRGHGPPKPKKHPTVQSSTSSNEPSSDSVADRTTTAFRARSRGSEKRCGTVVAFA